MAEGFLRSIAGNRFEVASAGTQATRVHPLAIRAMADVGIDLGGHNLGNLLRRLVLPVTIQDWSLTSLQQRLLKTGARLIRHARYFTLQLAESYLTGPLFRQILRRIERLAWHPT